MADSLPTASEPWLPQVADRNSPTLYTHRLILRKFTWADLNRIYLIFSDRDVNTYLPWFPLSSLEEASDFFQDRYLKAYSEPESYSYAVCMKSENLPIGYINLSLDDSHDLGYGLLKEYWNQGIITEAAAALISHACGLGVPYITATHDKNNPASGRVMEKLGMEYKYSYQELWQPKNFNVIFRMYQINLDGNRERIYKKYWDKYKLHFIENI